jgi:uncharacterized protein YybS (DUF2232 family)
VGIRNFPLWKPAEALIIPLGIAGIFVLTEESTLSMIGWNLLFVLFCLYTIFGLSFIEFQMRRRSFPTGIKVAVYLFLFLTQFVAAVVLPLIALFDSKFDFRKVRAKQIG